MSSDAEMPSWAVQQHNMAVRRRRALAAVVMGLTIALAFYFCIK